MKELSNAEKQLVFQMENWATYRYEDGTLMSYNSISGRVEPVKSFNLDSFIYFDSGVFGWSDITAKQQQRIKINK